ncbi:hypothetical protein [Bradyrhizobium cenepequi]
MTPTQKAAAVASELVRIWADWSENDEEASDNALRDACKEARAIDMHQVEGVIASPLNYFVRAYLDDENPEDLTYDEMMESMQIGLSLLPSD